MLVRTIQLGILLLFAAALAPAWDQSLDTLKEQARREDHPRLYAEVVRRQVDVANGFYTSGEIEKAQSAVAEIVSFTAKVLESAPPIKDPRKLKDTELTLSKASHRLEEVRRSLSLEDQPPVQDAVQSIEKARRELLSMMFDKKKADDKPRTEDAKQ